MLTMTDSQVMTLDDGRELGWMEFGDPGGWPVFGFHGTPGSRRQVCTYDAQARAAGVRLVAPDRPGYGFSTFHRARRLAGWPADVEKLADHLGIGRFSVVGVSGGGPPAAACAALLPGRVAAAGIVSGQGPLTHPHVAADLTVGTRIMASAARRCPAVLRLFMSAEVGVARRFPAFVLRIFLKQLPPADAEVLGRPEMRRLFQLEMGGASKTTGRAWAQDLTLFALDWGFDLAAIKVPVVLWQGTADQVVPQQYARVMHEEIPGSRLHDVEGQGHLLLVDGLEMILRELVPAGADRRFTPGRCAGPGGSEQD